MKDGISFGGGLEAAFRLRGADEPGDDESSGAFEAVGDDWPRQALNTNAVAMKRINGMGYLFFRGAR